MPDPTAEPFDYSVAFPGPRTPEWDVVVNSHLVRLLKADLSTPGQVTLTLDGRKALTLPAADPKLLNSVVAFIADCIAVGQGYTCHPTPGVPHPPLRPVASRVFTVTGVGDD